VYGGVIMDSLWLWLLAGSGLWAFLGLLAASKARLSPWLGAALGAVSWPFGVLLMSAVAILRQPTRIAHHTGRQRPRTLTEDGLLGLAMIGALGIIGSTFLSWGRWRAVWSANPGGLDGGLSPAGIPALDAFVIGSGVLLGFVAALSWWRPRGSWLAIAAIPLTWWITAISQVLILTPEVTSVAKLASTVDRSRFRSSVTVDIGLWLMYLSCFALVLWAAVSTFRLLRSRSRDSEPAIQPSAPPHPVPPAARSEWGFE